MNMSIGFVSRALPCAFLGLVLGASSGFAQSAPKRDAILAPNRYIVFLQDEPVSARFAKREEWRTAAAIAYRQQVESRQGSVMVDLAGRNITVAGSVSTLLNAIFVVAPPERLPELRSVPGVIGVMPERRVAPSLNTAVALAKAPAAWAQPLINGQANAGNGIKIGIIDSGIDQSNPAFDDTGFTPPPGTWPKCNAAGDCCPQPKGKACFTNNKVIVARSYVPMMAAGSNPANPAADSNPDDFSARDHAGHGTALAAAAAGVQTSGGTVAFSGMAPKAYLGSYKVFGSPYVSGGASESIVIAALEDAVNDGMDIVNTSLGAPAFAGALDDTACGNTAGVPCDPLAKAFETAAEAGTVITASVGNRGADPHQQLGENYPYYNSITSPATAPSAIGVGATVNSHVMNPTVTVNAANAPASLKGITAVMSDSYFFPSYAGANTGPLIDVATLPGSDGYACSALPAGSLKDQYALIQDGGSCAGNYGKEATAAGNAGAIGVVLYRTSSSGAGNPEGAENFVGPVVMISLSAGQTLKAYVDANPGASVTIDTAGSEATSASSSSLSALVNSLASYSSFGPTPDGAIKPDMVATGGYDYWQFPDPYDTDVPAPHGLYTAGQNYDPNGDYFTASRYVAVDGTSMAAALVAGAAALVKQAHPTWTAAAIKSALVNYSAQDVMQDDYFHPVDVEAIGAGRLDANAAVTATVTAVSQGPTSSLSFGYLAPGAALPKPIAVTVTNKGTSSVTLAVAATPGALSRSTTASVTVTTDRNSLTLAAGASATLNVSLTGTVPAAGEYSGAVTLTSASPAVSLSMPYMFLVGDGSSPNVVPLYGTSYYGAVGQDVGPLPVQLVDSWGVPVAGSTVTFTATPAGSVTFKPVPGTPGCTPSTSTSSVTCTTNNRGIAWIELVGGSSPIGDTSPATVHVVGGGQNIQISVSLVAAPVLQGSSGGGAVTDAAVYGSTIAPGSYVSLFGSNLVDPYYLTNPSGDSANATFSNGHLPLTWDGVTVSFDAAATSSLPAISVPGYVYFVSSGQVNVYAPWELENYPSVQVKLTYAESIRSNVVTVPVSNYTPAFLMNGGPPASFFVADARDNNTGALIGTANPATAGEVLQLYCNGLGPVSNQPASGDPAPNSPNLAQTASAVTVSIGGKNAPVIFAGLTPPFVGLYLVDVTVPSGLASGNQPISVSVAGKTSPASIAAGGTTYNIVLPVK